MPRFITIFLAVLALGSFTVLAWMLARPAPVDPRVAGLEAEIKDLKRENARLKQQAEQRPAVAPAVAAAQPKGANQVAEDLAAGAAGAAKGKGGLREMMATPGMQAMMEQQQSMQIDMGYGRLMTQLGLTDEERANFKDLLLQREKLQTQSALKLLDPNLTPEERRKITQEMQTQKEAYDQTFKTFLNNGDDFNTFKHWEDTQPERIQFDMMGRTLFSSSGEPLSDQQEQQLIDMMAEVRKSPAAPKDITAPGSDPSQLSPAQVEAYLKQLEAMHQTVQSKAGSILTPGQIKTLEAYLAQTRNMAETGINAAQMMLNQR